MSPLRQLTDEVARAERHLHVPADAWRGPGGGGFGGGGGGEAPGVGRNPPAGALIYFYLRQRADSEVRLEILDARDSLVRRWSTRPANPEDSLRVSTGLNRFVWDLRYPGAHRFRGLVFWAAGTQGPLAVPGTYKVRLTAGPWSATQPFTVRLDPRNHATTADLQRQLDLLLRIRDRVSAANDAVTRIREVKTQLEAAVQHAHGRPGGAEIAAGADSLKARLSAIEEEIYQVKNQSGEDPLNYPIKLNNRIASLAGVVGSADAPPTDQAVQVFEALSGLLQAQLDRLKTVLDADVPAFNALVKAKDVPAVIVK